MKVAAALIKCLFRFFELFPQQNKLAFFSKHAEIPLDFRILQDQIRIQSNSPVKLITVGVKANNRFTPGVVLRQIWHFATCKVCVVDSYIPAVCLPEKHRAVVIQLWHALGAIKKFGWQSVGTSEGRSFDDAQSFRMHRGYDYVIAATEEAIPFFAEAFDMPEEKIVLLRHPRTEYLISCIYENERCRATKKALMGAGFSAEETLRLDDAQVILYAPTFRGGVDDSCGKSTCSLTSEIINGLIQSFCDARFAKRIVLLIAAHPQEVEKIAIGEGCVETNNVSIRWTGGESTMDFLSIADLVITDYSAFAYEARAAQVPVWFYVPDIKRYSESPGLNINPLDSYSSCSFADADQLVNALKVELAHYGGLSVRGAFDTTDRNCSCGISTKSVVSFIEGLMQ